MIAETSPYTMDEQPTSTGRVLLARAFAHWCVLHHGHSPEEVAAALDPGADCDSRERRRVAVASRLLGELLAAGEMRASVRPIGAGSLIPLSATVWERDDFRLIFARSALDPTRPFDDGAMPTHWIFLDLDDFNRVVDASCGDVPRAVPQATAEQMSEPASRQARTERNICDDHVRIKELERRTGMSRATIYRRIDQKRFPAQIPMDGNIAAWREGDIADWLANPR